MARFADLNFLNSSLNYPFGMLMPGRQYNAIPGYRYGFNGKEKDKEGAVQYDYGFRIYDPRLVRFKSIDPLTYSYPYYTPYQFAGNMPIAAIDLDGLEQYVVTYYKDQNTKTTKIEVRAIFNNNDMTTALNQHVHKVGTTEDIAKGNVLVFEIKNGKDGKESMKIVDRKDNNNLTKDEANIFKKTKSNLETEKGNEQNLIYGTDKPKKVIYQSDLFVNADTKTYTAEFGITPPPLPPKTPPSVTEKKNKKTVVEMETYTTKSPDAYFPAKEEAKGLFKQFYEENKKDFKADILILLPIVHYNYKFPPGDPTQTKIVPAKRYTVPIK